MLRFKTRTQIAHIIAEVAGNKSENPGKILEFENHHSAATVNYDILNGAVGSIDAGYLLKKCGGDLPLHVRQSAVK